MMLRKNKRIYEMPEVVKKFATTVEIIKNLEKITQDKIDEIRVELVSEGKELSYYPEYKVVKVKVTMDENYSITKIEFLCNKTIAVLEQVTDQDKSNDCYIFIMTLAQFLIFENDLFHVETKDELDNQYQILILLLKTLLSYILSEMKASKNIVGKTNLSIMKVRADVFDIYSKFGITFKKTLKDSKDFFQIASTSFNKYKKTILQKISVCIATIVFLLLVKENVTNRNEYFKYFIFVLQGCLALYSFFLCYRGRKKEKILYEMQDLVYFQSICSTFSKRNGERKK